VKTLQLCKTIDALGADDVRLLIAAQRVTIAQASSALGPYGSQKFAKSLTKLLEVLEKYLEAQLKSTKHSNDPELETVNMMRIFASSISSIHEQYLRYLFAPDPYSFPVELLQPLKTLLTQFGGYEPDKTSFGLLHYDRYNFRVIGLRNPLVVMTRAIAESIQDDCPSDVVETMKDLPENFIFISYPKAEGRNIFAQGLLFHELGHAIDWKASISNVLFKAIKWQENAGKLPDVFESWVSEIVADLIGIRLLGPSLFFSARWAALTAGDLDQDSFSHPATRLRFLWMLEHLERLGYMDDSRTTKSKSRNVLHGWYKQLKNAGHGVGASLPSSEVPTEFKTVRSVLQDPQIRSKLHLSVEKKLPGPAFDAKRFHSMVPRVVENFRGHIPDCGVGKDLATHIASIFNAAWEITLADQGHPKIGADIYCEREILCGLALKSIEGNYIQSLWEKH
jgi:hypothetical protein